MLIVQGHIHILTKQTIKMCWQMKHFHKVTGLHDFWSIFSNVTCYMSSGILVSYCICLLVLHLFIFFILAWWTNCYELQLLLLLVLFAWLSFQELLQLSSGYSEQVTLLMNLTYWLVLIDVSYASVIKQQEAKSCFQWKSSMAGGLMPKVSELLCLPLTYWLVLIDVSNTSVIKQQEAESCCNWKSSMAGGLMPKVGKLLCLHNSLWWNLACLHVHNFQQTSNFQKWTWYHMILKILIVTLARRLLFYSAYGGYRNSYYTRQPEELQGQFVETHLMKTSRGFGFTIVGGDDTENGGCAEFLQIKSISPNSPAAANGKLCPSKWFLILLSFISWLVKYRLCIFAVSFYCDAI